jgi:hypothetical protein
MGASGRPQCLCLGRPQCLSCVEREDARIAETGRAETQTHLTGARHQTETRARF